MTLIEHDGLYCPVGHDSHACSGCATEELVRSLTSAVRAIAHGNVDGPGGLEALTMAISGEGSPASYPLSAAIAGAGSEVAQGMREVALGLHAVAKAIESRPGS